MRSVRQCNRKVSRLQAALVATLYVFLCTFGALTHSHADAGASARPGANHPAGLFAPGHGHGSPDCAFCDWQVNSVSPALAPHDFPPPARIAIAQTPWHILSGTPGRVQPSSRAPPLA